MSLRASGSSLLFEIHRVALYNENLTISIKYIPIVCFYLISTGGKLKKLGIRKILVHTSRSATSKNHVCLEVWVLGSIFDNFIYVMRVKINQSSFFSWVKNNIQNRL